MSQLHEDVDLGHTVAGWTGWAVAVVGTTVAGVGMCVWRPGIWLGLAICALAAVVTLVLHLVGWGKPAGPRPADQWDWRVRDRTARAGHPECVGCRLAGRRVRAGAPAPSAAVEGRVEAGSAPPVPAGGQAGIAGL
ncbi:hypothetical protein GCM10011583_35510 [Streptomyces camponoticapitis]|uniref:Integral membrane protein n=1 Tax=Streptomyces camponoticapitis TaxID=1616125 RepID=A0ABQ2E9K6_9ACTN|nr:HGxxPAAW family protein [Streptomyces camponoticapitis]GGK00961.1 hypothetical protein GCM10011583_35510 [Streptomyces camponoticapitis]